MVTEPARILLGDVEVTRVPEYAGKSPATRKTHVRGPLPITQARSDPTPKSFRFVTSITRPPRPPVEAEPPPCAPGKAAGVEAGVGVGLAGGGGAGTGAVSEQFAAVMTGTVPAEERPTVQPDLATTFSGPVTFTTPGVVEVGVVMV